MIAAIPLITSALSMLTSSDSTAQATGAASAAAAAKSATTQGADFGQVMSQVSSDAIDSVKKAESLSVDGLQGKATMQSVVSAVMTAQENLQSALAIRDKAVAAFTEVSHMAI